MRLPVGQVGWRGQSVFSGPAEGNLQDTRSCGACDLQGSQKEGQIHSICGHGRHSGLVLYLISKDLHLTPNVYLLASLPSSSHILFRTF